MQISISDAVFVYLLQDEDQLRWHSRTHRHSDTEYELHYFIQGAGSFKNAGVTWTLNQGSLFFSSPGDTHTIIPASKTNPVTYYAILFRTDTSDEEITNLMTELMGRKKYYNIGTNYRFFFEELKDKFLSNNRSRMNSGIHQFISFLYMMTEGPGSFHYSDSANAHIEKALKIMQNNVFSRLSLDELADRLKLNKSYLIRLFSRKMNTTPMKYLNHLKIEAASSMLISTGMPIYEISERLCFYSEFHFSKSFKQSKGIPPREYRTNYSMELPLPEHQSG